MVYRFELPSEENIIKIYADIGASKESIETGVQSLIQWMEQQPHLPKVQDTQFLSNYLVGSKNHLEIAKKKLNAYYIIKAQMPDIYTNRDPCTEEFKKCMKTMFAIPLPKLTPENYRIMIHGFGAHNPEDIPTTQNLMKLYTSIMDVNLKTDLVRGYIAIYDFANISTSLHKLIMNSCITSMQFMKNSVPVRIHKIYALNLSPAVKYLVDLGLNVIGKKLSSKVILWKKDPKCLTDIFPKEILPLDYGGEEQSIDELIENTLERLIHHRDWLLATDIEKADLSRISNYSSTNTDEFSMSGIEGSFRKVLFD